MYQNVYYEDEEFKVVICSHCDNIIYLWKDGTNPSQQQIDMMMTDAVSRFPGIRPEKDTVCVYYHYHFHMRSTNG